MPKQAVIRFKNGDMVVFPFRSMQYGLLGRGNTMRVYFEGVTPAIADAYGGLSIGLDQIEILRVTY